MIEIFQKIFPTLEGFKCEFWGGLSVAVVIAVASYLKRKRLIALTKTAVSRFVGLFKEKKVEFPVPQNPIIIEVIAGNCDVLINKEAYVAKLNVSFNIWNTYLRLIKVKSIEVDVTIGQYQFIKLSKSKEVSLPYSLSHQVTFDNDLNDKQEKRLEMCFDGHECAYTHLEFNVEYEMNGKIVRKFEGKNINLYWREIK